MAQNCCANREEKRGGIRRLVKPQGASPQPLPVCYYHERSLAVMLASVAVSVTVLASGSKGNCTVVSSSGTRLLVDAGLSCREILRRMVLCGVDPHTIDAVLITHEHSDHVSGVHVIAKRLKVPVYITGAT